MQGHFDLTMLHTPGLTRDLIEAVRREGGDHKVEEFLAQFKKEGQWSTDNLIFKVSPSFLYHYALSGPTPYGAWGGNYITGLAFITLTTTSAEPTYTGEEGYYSAYYSISWQTEMLDNVGNNPSKRFITDCIVTPDFKVDAAGREAVYGKFKWLYLPGEATSSTIRSVTIYSGSTDDLSYYPKTRMGRVRIKDSGGNPVTISKASTRSLLIEYTFTMPTL